MATTVAQHAVATFSSPVNGSTPIDANTVRGNDNTIRTSYNDHDADTGVHVQSSTLASRPAAGTAGRKWITSGDGDDYHLWFDDGTNWIEVGGATHSVLVRADAALAAGKVVKLTGYNATDKVPTVNVVAATSDTAFGVVEVAISSGATGYVIITGVIRNVINTSSFSALNQLYQNGSAAFTATKPTSGEYQPCAVVLSSHATTGVVYVEFQEPRIVERSDNTANTIVLRDGSGAFTTGAITSAGLITFASLKGTGATTVTTILDEDNMATDSATALATQQSIKAYVDTKVTAEDLDFAGGSGTGSVDLDSQTFTIAGTSNEITTVAGSQTLTISLPDDVTIGNDLTVTRHLDVDGTANLDNTDVDGTLVVDGSNISLDSTSTLNIDNSNTSNGITIGTATSGVPVSIGHTTSEVTVNDNLTVTGTLTLGSGAELTEAELEMLDGITAGTVAASKAVVVDSNKDIASFRNVTLTGELDAATLDVSGAIDVAGTANLDVVDIDGAVDMASTLQVDGAITGSSTIQGTTITATTAFVPDASDGASLGTAALEFSDLFLADGGIVYWGDDQEISIVHEHNTGLQINGANQIQFGDSGTYIHQSADGVLDLVSDTEIEINATTIDMNGAVDISGTTTLGADLSVPATNKILLDGGGNTYIQESSADVLQVVVGGNDAIRIRDSANDVNIQTLDLTVDPTQKIYLDGGGNTYIHESSADTMRFFCGGTSRFQVQSDGVMIPSGNNLFLDNGGDTYIVEGSANVMRFFAGGSKQFEVTGTNMSVVGALSKGSGSFRIDHPLDSMKDTHDLVHSFIEGPRADLIYRGSVQLSEGTATVDLDDAATMTDGTWELLCRDPQVWVQNEDGWTQVRGSVSGSTLTITAQDGDCTDTVSWLVVAERQDEHMMDTNWTDDNGRVIVEPEKLAEDEQETDADSE